MVILSQRFISPVLLPALLLYTRSGLEEELSSGMFTEKP